MNINKLSKLSGFSPATIRYYEEIKLLPAAKRGSNGYRIYTKADLDKLKLIEQAKSVGFTLHEMKSLIPIGQPEWNNNNFVELLEKKVQDITVMQEVLTKNKMKLITVIESLKKRPDNLSCNDNLQYLINQN